MFLLRKSIIALFAFQVAVLAPAYAGGACPVPALMWGSTGTNPGQFIQPFGIHIEPDGLVYVTDQANERVQVFTSSGIPQLNWSIPPGPSGFAHPTGVFVRNGVVWVSAHQGHTVQRYTTAGGFLGYAATPPGGWAHPTSIVGDAAGNIYVCDSSHDRVVKLDALGTYVSEFPTGSAPYGIDIDEIGDIYVGCYGDHRVYKYDFAGNPILSWGGFGSGPGQFYAAEGIAHDTAGDIYVCDTGNDRIQKFSSNGTYLCEFGMNGIALGQLDVPSDLAIDSSGDLFVVEYLNNRVHRFTFGPTPAASRTWGSVKTMYR